MVTFCKALFPSISLIQCSPQCLDKNAIRGHSIITWTEWGGRVSKNVCFCPRSGNKNCPRRGKGVKKRQNSVHVVIEWPLIQVNLFQKHLFLHQLTHYMSKYCSLIYQFSPWKLQAQNKLCTQIDFLVLFWHSKQFMYTICSELVVFMYRTGKSMNNLLSYCGLVDVRIRASNKDLLTCTAFADKFHK